MAKKKNDTLAKIESDLSSFKKKKVTLEFLDDSDLSKKETARTADLKSYLRFGAGEQDLVQRLAFEVDPLNVNSNSLVYRPKIGLIPDELLKRIAITDDLVAAIVNTRSNQIASFGRQQSDRFSTGFRIEAKPGLLETLPKEEAQKLVEKMNRLAILLTNCGDPTFGDEDDKMNLSQFLAMTCRDAVIVGRFAVEIIYGTDENGEPIFNSFRPVDAATIYKANPHSQGEGDRIRETAVQMLADLKNEDIVNFDPDKFKNDEYKWWQVVQFTPRQAFTSKELIVVNVYPVTDVMLGGYPVTPLDTVMNAVTMHLNITTHNKMYFQTGRAAKGILVIKSADIDPDVIKSVRQQFHASINSVNNAWRLPVFGVGPEDEVVWQNINSGASDMEFQYLSDQNVRVILSAFQMSPDEIPGYNHLSKGSNNQSLSESNNEYKLEAARDVGIRPLLAKFQDFLNNRLLPIIDEELARVCWIRLVGLDSETPEKESIRLQQDGAIHMTMNEILAKVDKGLLDRHIGGDMPLNEAYRATLDAYFTVGQVLEYFCGIEGAAADPKLQYRRDSWWFQNRQLEQQKEQMDFQKQQAQAQMQAQQQQMAAQQQQQQGGGQQRQGQEGQGQEQQRPQSEIGGLADQTIAALGKSEKQLSSKHLGILQHQEDVVNTAMESWEVESKQMIADILKTIESDIPKK